MSFRNREEKPSGTHQAAPSHSSGNRMLSPSRSSRLSQSMQSLSSEIFRRVNQFSSSTGALVPPPAPKEVRYNFLVVGPKKSGKSTFIRSLGHCEATDASSYTEAAEKERRAKLTEQALEKRRKKQEARARAEQQRAEALANRGTFTKVLDFLFDEETLPSIPEPVDLVEPPPRNIQEAINRVDLSLEKMEYRILIKEDIAHVTEVSQLLLRTYVWLAREKAAKAPENKKMIDACILCISAEDCVRRNTDTWENAVKIRNIIDKLWPTGFPVILLITKMGKLNAFGAPTLDLACLRDELGCLAVFSLDTLSLPQQEFYNLQTKIHALPFDRPVMPWSGTLKDSFTAMQNFCHTVDDVRQHPERPLPTPRSLFHRGFHRLVGAIFNFLMDHYPELFIALGMTTLMVCIFAIPAFGQALGFAAYVTHGWLLMVKLLTFYVKFTELYLLLGVQIASFIALGLTTFGLTYGGIYLTRRALEGAPQEPCNYYGDLGYESMMARVLFREGAQEIAQAANTDSSYQPLFQPGSTDSSSLSRAPEAALASTRHS